MSPTVARTDTAPGLTSPQVAAIVGTTTVTLHRWVHAGYFGAPAAGGQGTYRRWNDADVEVALAIAALTALGAVAERRHGGGAIVVTQAAAVVRARRVAETGELLVAHADGRVHRFEHWCARVGEVDAGTLVIPLRPYPAVASSLPNAPAPLAALGRDDGTAGFARTPAPAVPPTP